MGLATSEGLSSKERIQEWIKSQSSVFLDQWAGSEHSNPALDVVKRLEEASEKLDPKSTACLSALTVSVCVCVCVCVCA